MTGKAAQHASCSGSNRDTFATVAHYELADLQQTGDKGLNLGLRGLRRMPLMQAALWGM